MVLLSAIIVLIFVELDKPDSIWADKAFSWLSGAFLFIAGIALGKGGREMSRKRFFDEDD
jgi:hypothetical protein